MDMSPTESHRHCIVFVCTGPKGDRGYKGDQGEQGIIVKTSESTTRGESKYLFHIPVFYDTFIICRICGVTLSAEYTKSETMYLLRESNWELKVEC